jgi:hypothetical protein
MSILIDSYDNNSPDSEENFTNYNFGFGQSFTSSNIYTIKQCKFSIKKELIPTGNAYAKIYAHAGTYGISSVPTGSALATSDPLDVSTLTTSYQLISFNFSGANQINLSATYYVLTLEYANGDNFNRVKMACDTTAGASGSTSRNDGSWLSTGNATDNYFYIYGDIPVTAIPQSYGIII